MASTTNGLSSTIHKSYTKYVIAFVVVALITVGVIVYFTFSKTTISLVPQPVQAETQFTIQVAEKDPGEGTTALPGRFVSVTVDGSKIFQGNGEVSTEEGISGGTVILKNTSGTDQELVATTRLLSSDGVLFRLDNGVNVPAGDEVAATVSADQAGQSGDIAPTNFTIPGLAESRQTQVFAVSETQMTGGLRSVSSLTIDDIASAKDEMVQSLYDQALSDLEHEVANSDSPYKVILPGSLHRVIGFEEVDAEPGEQRSEFRVSMAMKITAVMFDEQALLSHAVDTLESELTEDKELWDVSNDELFYAVSRLDAESGVADLTVKFAAPSIITLNSAIVNREPILNKDSQDISAYFSSFKEVDAVDVQFSPFWVVRAPSLTDHIEINIQEPGSEGDQS